MARRHALTLSEKERLILQLLSAADEMYGLQLVAASRKRLKRGTVYVTLNRMEEKGYISSRLADEPTPGGGLPLRLYEPTTLGARLLALTRERAGRFVPEFGI